MDDEPGNIADLGLARFARDMDPKKHNPLMALEAAKKWIIDQPEPADHVIILIGRTTGDNGSGTKFFQAGNYPHHAQMGLCLEGMELIRS